MLEKESPKGSPKGSPGKQEVSSEVQSYGRSKPSHAYLQKGGRMSKRRIFKLKGVAFGDAGSYSYYRDAKGRRPKKLTKKAAQARQKCIEKAKAMQLDPVTRAEMIGKCLT